MKKFFTFFLITSLVLSAFQQLQAQDKIKTKVTADIVSSFVWRGVPGYAPLMDQQNLLAPSIQPTFALDIGNLEIGAWGSGDFTGTYKEVDLYASYTLKSLTFTFTDYYWDLGWLGKNYFEYENDSTSHVLEGAITFRPEKIPLSFTLATMFFGADKKATNPEENNYSTYIEAGYSLPVGSDKLDFFLGVTPFDGFYGDGYGGKDGFGLVNAGVTGYKNLKISTEYELPLKASLIFNPQHEKIYLVLGITL